MPSIESLVQNPWFQFSGFAVGVIGVVIALVTWLLSRRYKRLYFLVRSFNLVDKSRSTVPSLSVQFGGRTVAALTISKIAIWNSGKEAIRDVDIPSREKLRITPKEGVEILESSIIQVSSESCNCRLGEYSNSSQTIQFDFLDPNDGIVLHVAHTGSSSEELKVEGQIVGKGKIAEKSALGAFNLFPFIKKTPRTHRRRPRALLAIFMSITGIFILLSPFFSDKLHSFDKTRFSFIMSSIGGVFYVFAGYSIWASRPPKGLSKFDDSFEQKTEK